MKSNAFDTSNSEQTKTVAFSPQANCTNWTTASVGEF
jgi:hypothetical protein